MRSPVVAAQPLAEQEPGDEEPRQHEERVEREHAAGGEVAGVHRDREPDREARASRRARASACCGGASKPSRRQWFGAAAAEDGRCHVSRAPGSGAHRDISPSLLHGSANSQAAFSEEEPAGD